MHDTGCSGLVHWDDPEGWDAEGVERGEKEKIKVLIKKKKTRRLRMAFQSLE